MTLLIKHNFTSVKADGPDATLVQPSAWNDSHVITLSTGKIIGRSSGGSGAAEELSLAASLALAGGVIGTVAMTGDVTSSANSLATTIANSAVTTAKIADGAVTAAKLAPDVQTVPTGVMMPFIGSEASVPSGYVLMSGQTLGSSSSGAAKNGATYQPLYEMLWNSMSNTVLPILDSSGSATTRGANAAADFAANKRLPTPDMRGRMVVGLDNMGGVTANRLANDTNVNAIRHTLGGAGGTDAHALTSGQNGPHTHGAGSYGVSAIGVKVWTNPNDAEPSGVVHDGLNCGFRNGTAFQNNGTELATVTTVTGGAFSGTSASSGSGDAHPNMPPVLMMNWIIKY